MLHRSLSHINMLCVSYMGSLHCSYDKPYNAIVFTFSHCQGYRNIDIACHVSVPSNETPLNATINNVIISENIVSCSCTAHGRDLKPLLLIVYYFECAVPVGSKTLESSTERSMSLEPLLSAYSRILKSAST